MTTQIMVIDDDQSMQDMFSEVLSDEGYEVFAYEYPAVRLAKVQELQPDLIILDISMYQQSAGWSFLQLLKMEDSTAVIPVIVCTTATHLSQEIESYLVGRHITLIHKPFDLDQLLKVIEQMLDLKIQGDVYIDIHANRPILVVEDNAMLRKMLSLVLRMEGYPCTTAVNGLQALEAVSDIHYSLILLDIAMPVMNGLEFLAAYDATPGLHTPVIIVSAEANYDMATLPAFVIDMVAKPYDVNQLLLLIDKHALFA